MFSCSAFESSTEWVIFVLHLIRTLVKTKIRKLRCFKFSSFNPTQTMREEFMTQKHYCVTFGFVVFLTSVGVSAQSGNNASQAVDESGKASPHLSKGAGYSIVASGQVTSAAVAVPLSIGGAVLGSAAALSADAGALAMTAAKTPIGQPLPVSDRVVTTLPPNQALKNSLLNQ